MKVDSLATGRLPAQIIAAHLKNDGWTDLVVRNAADGTLSVYLATSPSPHSIPRSRPGVSCPL